MKLNGNTSKRSAAARREAADFAAQERSARRSGSNRSAQSEAAARRAAAPKQTAPQRPPVPRQDGGAAAARRCPEPRRSRKIARPRRQTRRAHRAHRAGVLVAAGAVGMVLVAKRAPFSRMSLSAVPMSAATQAAAADAIRAAGWDDTSAPVFTMTFPGDRSITVTATEIGFDATPDAAAETAYAYGRSGNAFSNFFTWLRCAFKGHDVAADNLADMDEDALRTRIEREAAEINVSLSAGSIEIDEAHSTIRVVKGASMITLDPAAVADRMLSDIRAGKFGTSAYPVDMSGDDKMTLQELHDAVCGDPVNAGYDPETQSATESKVGIEFDVAAAQPLWDAASTGDTVTIPATLTQPEMTQEQLQKHLLADKLATKTTSLSGSSSNRITNVRLAAEKINGVILQPGQTFSYNDVVGQRTKANGFKEAGAYSGGQVVQEVGGGICQVSSTLYYCAMVSNLKINTRTCHYFPVSYIEPGMDATVSWGGPEFKFTNNRDYPIEIKAYVQNGSVTVEIWGTDVDGSYVKMSYTAEGLRATTYRTVYDKDGNQISHTVEASSTYHSHDTTPKPTPTPSATPAPTPTPTPKPQQTPYPSIYDPGDAGED
ncbi:MAG: VanW family protein [Oscillospiraceae bacterium]